LIEAFNVKKGNPPFFILHNSNVIYIVPPKKLAKRKRIDDVKPVSGLDIEALLSRGGSGEASESTSGTKRQKLEGKIGVDDPAKDFKRLIENEETSLNPGFFTFCL